MLWNKKYYGIKYRWKKYWYKKLYKVNERI